MERKIQKKVVYEGFGFKLNIIDVPMVKVRGKWTMDIDYNRLRDSMFRAMADKPVRLTGSEIRFVRHYMNMTQVQFARYFEVTHAAVSKWEKCDSKLTKMKWSIEKLIRMEVLSYSKTTAKEFKTIFEGLREPKPSKTKLSTVHYEDLIAC